MGQIIVGTAYGEMLGGKMNGPIRRAVLFSQLPDGVSNGELSIHVNRVTVSMSSNPFPLSWLATDGGVKTS